MLELSTRRAKHRIHIMAGGSARNRRDTAVCSETMIMKKDIYALFPVPKDETIDKGNKRDSQESC
jgi:hypothetical protein